jgi:pimeloyl-ACP methyl ester carboxylesterase
MSSRTVTIRRLAGAGAALGAAAWAADALLDARRRANGDRRAPSLPDLPGGEEITVEAADGTRLHARVFGAEDAPTVVLVHAWMCALQLWQGQIEDLMDEFRVVAYDHRGHGRSEAARSDDYSIEMLGSDVGSVLEACVPDGERAVLAGHSTGAMSFVAWAGDNPEEVSQRISAAALINTGMGDLISESTLLRVGNRLGPARREALARTLMASRAAIPPRPTLPVRRTVRRVAFGSAASPSQVTLLTDLVLACPPEARAGFGLTLAGLDINDAVKNLTIPTVVIAGEHDRLTPPSHSRRLADELPDPVELVELPGVGHMAPIEARERVSAILRRLLERGS